MSLNNGIEKILEREGFLIFTGSGDSMLPLIRDGVDSVEVRALVGDSKAGDIVLYKTGDRYVLHRVLEVHDDYCLTRGDNCVLIETVSKDNILGTMTALWRGENKISLNAVSYRLYVLAIMRSPKLIRFGKNILYRHK